MARQRRFQGSPGRLGSSPVGIVINEVLANSDRPGALDAIELLNVSTQTINLSGWYLSDSANDLLKYPLPPAHDWRRVRPWLLTENQFNSPQAGDDAFALNGDRGDDVWLVAADSVSGKVQRFVDDVHFGAMAAGESWGRVPNGQGYLGPLTSPIASAAINGPRVLARWSSARSITIRLSRPRRQLGDRLGAGRQRPGISSRSTTRPPSDVDLSTWQIRGGVDFDFRPGTTARRRPDAAGGSVQSHGRRQRQPYSKPSARTTASAIKCRSSVAIKVS